MAGSSAALRPLRGDWLTPAALTGVADDWQAIILLSTESYAIDMGVGREAS